MARVSGPDRRTGRTSRERIAGSRAIRTALRTASTEFGRPLDLGEMKQPTVAIRSPGYHPFIFRKMIDGPVGEPLPQPGDIVRVVHREGDFVGHGLWNPRSQIALRLVSTRADPPDRAFWQERLHSAVRLRRELLRLDLVTNAYRVVHAEADGLSGLVIDRLNDVLSVECFSLGIYQRVGGLLALLKELLPALHHRVTVDERIARAEDFSGRSLASEGLPPSIVIEEHGVRYRVRFEGSHKTGFFCDQRENRRRLAEFCENRAVLDLCCYTGGFGLNAKLHGSAKDVTCVDLDESALALSKENANLNQVRLNFVHSDAFGYLRQMGVNGREYGVIVLDPPKLIFSRDDISAGKRKYFDLNVLAMSRIEPGGILLSCSCSGLLGGEELLGILRAAARQAGRSVRVLAVTGAAADHPVALDVPETGYLKAVWMVLES